MYKVTTCMVCFPFKIFLCCLYASLNKMFSISKLRLQQFYQKGKFLSSVYSFITSPGTLPQEIVICFRLGIQDQPSLGGT